MSSPLLIFDCDGVLVDSEHINSTVFYEMVQARDIDISFDLIHKEMLGGALHDAIQLIERTHNKSLGEDFIQEFRTNTFDRFKSTLKPINGILSSLEKLTYRKCIASNGPLEKMALNLEVTGIIKHFDKNHIFSAYDIQTWKPEPDLFFHALKKMNGRKEEAIIVEDSMNGVKGAINAGIKVIAYAVPDKKDQLAALGPDLIIEDMHDLPNAIEELI